MSLIRQQNTLKQQNTCIHYRIFSYIIINTRSLLYMHILLVY